MNERLDLTRALVTTAVVIAAGHGSGIAVAEPGQIAWRVHFDGLYTDFEPVVAPDGTIVTGNADFVTAVNPDGSVRWSTPATARQGETSVGPDGTVYAVSGTSIIALDAFDGQVLWTFSGSGGWIVGGPNVGPDGNIFAVGDTEAGGIGMFSLTPQGALRWSDEGDPPLTDDEGNGHRITFSGNRVLVGMVPGTGNPPMTIWAYNLDGNQQYLLGEGCAGQLAVGPDGSLVTGIGLCQKVQTYDPSNGSLLMSQAPPSQSPCSGLANVAVGPDGSIYTAFCYRAFWALHPDGTQKWFVDDFAQYFWMDQLGVAPDNSVVLDLGRNPGVHGWVRAFDTSDGSLNWQIDLPNEDGHSVRSVSEPVFDGGKQRAYFNASRGISGESYLYAVDLVGEPGIVGDVDADGVVGILDFLALLAAWGPCPDPPEPCPADLDGDSVVGITDFLILLGNWG